MRPFEPYVTDVDTTLVNLSNSILGHYGHPTFHGSIPEFDHLFKGHRKIAVFLFDGMGKSILEAHPVLGRDFLKHGFKEIHSVNPATTVACTTAFLTAKFPVETGWIGWSQQFDNYGIPIDCFRGTSSIDKTKVEGFSMDKECPVTRIDALLKEVGVKAKISYQYPLSKDGPKNYKEIADQASEFFSSGGEFLYSYWQDPDSTIHDKGTKSLSVGWKLFRLSKTVKRFVAKNPDVLTLVIADHGLIDVDSRDFANHPALSETQSQLMSLDGRFRAFFVKPDRRAEFRALMEEYYPEFILLTPEEALSRHLFGTGEPHPRIKEFLGDYLGTTSSNLLLNDSTRKKNVHILKGHHAGITKEEKTILVLAYNH